MPIGICDIGTEYDVVKECCGILSLLRQRRKLRRNRLFHGTKEWIAWPAAGAIEDEDS